MSSSDNNKFLSFLKTMHRLVEDLDTRVTELEQKEGVTSSLVDETRQDLAELRELIEELQEARGEDSVVLDAVRKERENKLRNWEKWAEDRRWAVRAVIVSVLVMAVGGVAAGLFKMVSWLFFVVHGGQ